MLRPLLRLSGVCGQLIEILADRARNLFLCSLGSLHRLGLILAFPVGIRGDGAAIHRCRLSAHKTKGRAAIDNHFEDSAQDVAIRNHHRSILS